MKRYPGLSPFSAEQKEVFFGRTDDIKELSKLIFIERKVLLYSKSGYGKTSLLNAGVIPELQKNKDYEFIKIRFRAYIAGGDSPTTTFLQTVKQHPDFKGNTDKKTLIDDYAPQYADAFWSVFKRNQLLGNKNKTYILVFDQFEELFTYPNQQVDDFKNRLSEIIISNKLPHFFEEIEDQIFENKAKVNKADIDVLYEAVNIKAVFSMRSDRLSQLNYLADKITDIQKVFYELKPLTTAQAQQAIEEPAKKDGDFDSQKFTFTKTALEKILVFLTNKNTQNVESTQLQIVCQRIEEQGDDDGVINDYEVPDFKNIFTEFYNSAIEKVPVAEQAQARLLVENELIRSRQRISLDRRLCTEYITADAIQTLVEAYLIRGERNSVGDISYELSHDSLIEPISEVAEKRRLKDEADRKEKERLEELRLAKEKQRKQRRTISIVVALALLFLAIGVFGVVMWQRAVEQTRIATQKTEEANKSLNAFIQAEKDRKKAEADKKKSKARTMLELKQYDVALGYLNEALAIDSADVEIDSLIKVCNEKIK